MRVFNEYLGITHLNIPSVCAPLYRRTSSDSVVCIHGNLRSGNLSFCSSMTSSSELPNIEGEKTDFYNTDTETVRQHVVIVQQVHTNIKSQFRVNI